MSQFESPKSSVDQSKSWAYEVNPQKVQKVEKSEQASHDLTKINNILGILDFDDDKEENKYRQILENLDQAKLEIVAKMDKASIGELFGKPQSEILKFLIQTQIAELEKKDNLTKSEKKLRYELKEQFIALEKAETANNKSLIAAEDRETEEIKKTDKKLAELEGALLSIPKIRQNSNIKDIRSLFADYKTLNREDEKWKQGILDKIINKLKNPGTLESIVRDLGWTDNKEYLEFKTQLLAAEPSLQDSFDRVEMKVVSTLAKLKLWTDSLDGVNLENDVLTKTEGEITIEAWKDSRNLSLLWSDYKLESKLNWNYEQQVQDINDQAVEELKPVNDKLNALSSVLSLLQNAKTNGSNFSEIKKQIHQQNPEIYSEYWLSDKNSFDDMIFAASVKKSELEKSKKKISKKYTEKLEAFVILNKKEAQEKDRAIKAMLKFLNSIWFDDINQNKLNTIIATVNINPQRYGLQQKIDFQNGSLGFDKDFWDAAISSVEKKEFIQFFNTMLWENIIDENIALGITTFSPEAQMRLQVLNNRTTGYFLENLNKKKSG